MTITDAVSFVLRRMNEDAAVTPNWSTAEIYQLFEARSNEAVAVLGMIEGVDSTTTVVSGTSDYAYPSNFIRVRRVWYAGQPLKYLPFRQFESRMPSGVAPTGIPREFTLWNNTIMLIPTPSFTGTAPILKVFGEKKQSSISSISSTLDLPEVFHQAVCDGVIADMYTKDLNNQMATMFGQKWLNVHIPAMREFAKQRRRTGSPVTVVDADSNLETDFGVV